MKNLFDTQSPSSRRKLAWLLLGALIIGQSMVSGFSNFGQENMGSPFSEFGLSETETFSEKYIEGEGENKIVVLHVDGVLADAPEQELFSSSGVVPIRQLARQIDQAIGDPQVKSLLVMVNSPGGVPTPNTFTK